MHIPTQNELRGVWAWVYFKPGRNEPDANDAKSIACCFNES